MTQRLGREDGGVLLAALFLYSGFLCLLLIVACWPALFNQHRQMRLAADNAGDAATQLLQAPMRAWAAGVLSNKTAKFNQAVSARVSSWASAVRHSVYASCMSDKNAKAADCAAEASDAVAAGLPTETASARQQVASSMFPNPAAALQALEQGNPVTADTFAAEVTPREAGCGVQSVATANRDQMESTARAYASANGAEGIEEFQVRTLADRMKMSFYAVRAIRLPIFSNRTGPSDRTRALSTDEFFGLFGVSLDNAGPCP